MLVSRLLVLLLAACCCCPAAGVIKTFGYNAGREILSESIVEKFGMAAGGRVSIDATVSSHAERVAFSLFTKRQWEECYERVMNQNDPSRTIELMCYSPAAMRFQTNGSQTSFRFTVEHSDQYTLQVMFCRGSDLDGGGAVPLRVSGTAEMSNVNLHSAQSGRTHLPLGRERELYLYQGFLATYLLLALLWMSERFVTGELRRPLAVGCTAVLLAKVTELAVKIKELDWIRHEGTDREELAAMRLVAVSVADMSFLALLLVASLGWTLTHNQLTTKEKKVLGCGFSLYMIVAVLKALCNDMCSVYETCGAKSKLCSAYLLTEYVIKSLIMLGIIVAMNFNITHLRTLLHEERWHAIRSPATYVKLKRLQSLRVGFLVVLFFPTILLIIKITVLSWRYEWATQLLNELLLLAIYVYIGLVFRPSYGHHLHEIAAVIVRNGVQLQPAVVEGDDPAERGQGVPAWREHARGEQEEEDVFGDRELLAAAHNGALQLQQRPAAERRVV